MYKEFHLLDPFLLSATQEIKKFKHKEAHEF